MKNIRGYYDRDRGWQCHETNWSLINLFQERKRVGNMVSEFLSAQRELLAQVIVEQLRFSLFLYSTP